MLQHLFYLMKDVWTSNFLSGAGAHANALPYSNRAWKLAESEAWSLAEQCQKVFCVLMVKGRNYLKFVQTIEH